MKKKKYVWALFAALWLVSCALMSCGGHNLLDYVSKPDTDKVDQRFHDSRHDKCKPIVPPGLGTDHFTFLWLSDIHIDTEHDNNLDKLGPYAAEHAAVFILHSGDNVDDGKEEQYNKFQNLLDNYITVPYYTALGNHDLYNDGWKIFKKDVGPSVFEFEYGTGEAYSHFIFIDSANGTLGRDQMDWLEHTLKKSHAKHKFILSHFPVYDGNLTLPTLINDPEERYRILGLCDKYNVDFFLAGHKHTGQQWKISGTWYIISGAGSTWKDIIDETPHFYRFEVNGSHVDFDRIHFSDI